MATKNYKYGAYALEFSREEARILRDVLEYYVEHDGSITSPVALAGCSACMLLAFVDLQLTFAPTEVRVPFNAVGVITDALSEYQGEDLPAERQLAEECFAFALGARKGA